MQLLVVVENTRGAQRVIDYMMNIDFYFSVIVEPPARTDDR